MPTKTLDSLIKEMMGDKSKKREPGWFYDKDAKSVYALWEDVPYYGEVLNPRITLYRAHKRVGDKPKERVIGVMIKGIESLKEMKNFRPMY